MVGQQDCTTKYCSTNSVCTRSSARSDHDRTKTTSSHNRVDHDVTLTDIAMWSRQETSSAAVPLSTSHAEEGQPWRHEEQTVDVELATVLHRRKVGPLRRSRSSTVSGPPTYRGVGKRGYRGVTPPLSADVGSLSATVELVYECLVGCVGSELYALL